MRTLVAIPCMDTIPTKFMECLLNLGFKGDCEIGLAFGSLIYDARDQLAEKAVNEGFDRVLWPKRTPAQDQRGISLTRVLVGAWFCD